LSSREKKTLNSYFTSLPEQRAARGQNEQAVTKLKVQLPTFRVYSVVKSPSAEEETENGLHTTSKAQQLTANDKQ
jgi:hypothetical protein